MRKITLLMALCLTFLCNLATLAAPNTTYLWWLRQNGDQVSDWVCLDDVAVFVNKKPTSPNYNKVRFGREAYYFETDYHHVYINELKATFHTKDNIAWAYSGGYVYYNFLSDGKFYYESCEDPRYQYNYHNEEHSSRIQRLYNGDEISIKSVREYLHVWTTIDYHENSFVLNTSINDWTNITHSTSEYYSNYLTNDFIEENREPNFFEIDEHGDGTYLLHPGWLCDTHTSYSNYYDHHNYVTDCNWTGTSATVYNMHDHYNGKYGGWQQIKLDHDGDYTVQAIVRGPAGGNVTLRLSSNGNTSESTQKVYGTNDDSPSTVNTFGRVDYWDMGTNAGWTKVETTLTGVIANQQLKIELLSDAAFEVSDVTLLKDANKDDVSFWTTAGLDETTTSREMLATKVIDHHQGIYNVDIQIHFPYYNKFSFFDRGKNKNGVVYAHPKTVIGMPEGMADNQDHAHACNVAVPYYDVNRIYGTGAENNVEDETNITCKKLKLTDTDGSAWNNVHAFGISKSFTAKEVSFDRTYKNGQKSTCVFPFAMTASELTDFFGSNKIYEFAHIDGTTANFNEVTTGSTANKPFLVYPTKDGSISLSTKNIVASNNLTTEDSNGNQFVGVYRYTAFPAGYINNTSNPLIYMFNAQNENGLYGRISPKGADIKPFRAYMQVPRSSAAPAKFFVSFLFGETNSISDMLFQEKTNNPSIYNINGTRVMNVNSLRKGMYIVDGKKVILK